MTAFEITENMKIGWNLGNTMDAKASDINGDLATAGVETETAWGCPKANQTLFDALKAKGFNTVRIPTTWFQHLDSDNNIDPAWMARVKEVVDYGIKNDMYIILNVHHENWINRKDLLNAYDDIQPKLMKIWTQIATEFKDYDQHLIFECMNEPRAARLRRSHQRHGRRLRKDPSPYASGLLCKR
jgi:aryl-phospho-beta-D-glucosidase BglC (GH1 family)